MKIVRQSLCLAIIGILAAGLLFAPAGFAESWCGDSEWNVTGDTTWGSALASASGGDNDTAIDRAAGMQPKPFENGRLDRHKGSSVGMLAIMAFSVAVIALGAVIAILAFFGLLPGRMGGQYGRKIAQVDNHVRAMVLGRAVADYAPVVNADSCR